MTVLVCPDCSREHTPGLTGIDADGKPTCLDCSAVLQGVDHG